MLNFLQISVTLLLAISLTCEATNLVGNFSEGGPVYGVGAIGEEVYVIHESNSYIDVHGGYSSGFGFKHQINVTGMNGPYDMALSVTRTSAFIIDWFDSNNTFQINLRPTYLVNKWSFNPGTFTSVALSFSEASQHILVTESQTNKLKEFTISGSSVKTIILQNITSPRQAVKISDNQYAVCFGYAATEKHQVCLVDGNGTTLGCFGGDPGNSTIQLNVPSRLFALSDGSILVGDSTNKRILKLSSTLSNIPAKVIVSASQGLSVPYRIFVDESRDLLYVADNTVDPVTGYATAGRVLVYNISGDFPPVGSGATIQSVFSKREGVPAPFPLGQVERKWNASSRPIVYFYHFVTQIIQIKECILACILVSLVS